jgi:NAD+ diphosphatase
MIQDIHPHLFSNHFSETRPSENDYIFHFRENKLLLRQNENGFEILCRKELTGSKDSGIFLFSLNQRSCFLMDEITVPEEPHYIYQDISFFRTIQQKEVAWTSVVALQLMNWYEQNRYCGRCGLAMSPKADERALQCKKCGNIVYPKISPAIIVAIISRDKILLGKGINFRSGFYSLIAGYADIGESLEETVIREVREEVGIDVFNIRYYKSQPWPLSGSMMLGFIAEADDTQPVKIDDKEIADAGWFTRDNMPPHSPSSISIAGEMIELFEKGML